MKQVLVKKNFKLSIFIFTIFKLISNECIRDTPLKLVNNSCMSQCSEEQFKSSQCIIDNQIIKTQWLNNIISIKEGGFKYLNIVIYPNGDMVIETHPFPKDRKRILYGLKQNGRFFFRDDDYNETPILTLFTEEGKKDKFESAISFLILNNKEYILSIGRLDSYTEIFDFEKKEIYSNLTTSLFGYSPNNYRGNLINLNNKNNYLYECLSSINNKITSIIMRFELSMNNLNEIIVSNKIEFVRENAFGDIQSFFITDDKNIVLFYGSTTPSSHYIIVVLDQNLIKLNEEGVNDNNINKEYYFSCIHYKGEIGSFLYFKKINNVFYPYIFFKEYNSQNTNLKDYFSKNINNITLDKYKLGGNILHNDFIKVSNTKLGFFSLSEDLYILYIAILNIVDSSNIKIRYYKINAYNLFKYKVHKEIKAVMYNNFIVFGSIQCPTLDCTNYYGFYFPSLIIFNYPTSVDSNINILELLFKNNQININNTIHDFSPNPIIDNNLFGYIFDGILIQNIIKTTEKINLYTYNENKLIEINDKINMEEKIRVKYIKNEFNQFMIKIEFAFIVTEPEYEKYDKYPDKIDTKYGNDSKDYFNNHKESYIGKTLYYEFFLNESLNNNCENPFCELCLSNNLSYCITCKYNFSIINNQKICDVVQFSDTIEIIDIDDITTIIDIYTCSNENIIKNKCTNITIPNNQEREIYNILKNQINKNNYNKTIVKTKNYIAQISTLEEQKNNDEISSINLGECENILKENKNKSFIILKTDIKSEDLLSTYVLFELYDSENTTNKVDLEICKDIQIQISVPKILDNETLFYYVNLNEFGYNLFNPNDSFYNDICSKFTTINKKDMILSDRWEDIYIPSNDKYYCQENCKINSYNISLQKVTCDCILKKENFIFSLDNINFDYKEVIPAFQKTFKSSNFFVLKCYKLIFNFANFSKNIGSIFMSIIIIIFFILMIVYCFTGQKKVDKFIKKIVLSNNIEKNKTRPINAKKRKLNKSSKILKNNPPKKEVIVKGSNKIINVKKLYSIFVSPSPNFHNQSENHKCKRKSWSKNNSKKERIKININNIKKKKKSLSNNNNKNIKNNKKDNNNIDKQKKNKINNIKLNSFELNNLPYLNALKLDKRSFFKYYISLLRRKHLIIFSFIPYDDYNLISIKLSYFLVSFSAYLTINSFFFNDKTMHQIYEDESEYNIIQQLFIILLSSIISSILNIIFKLLALSEKDILSIKKEKNLENYLKLSKQVKKELIIKFILFYISGFVFLFFFWFFISCFCAVFVNTSIVLLKNTFISFIISMLYPFGLNILPGLLRILALKDKKKTKECLYKISIYLSQI